MAKKITIPTKIPAYYQIGILFPDGKKIIKNKVSLNELFEIYFLNLDKHLNKEYSAEQLLELYQKTYYNKGIKVVIKYIDSWSHTWSGKVAWPKESKFIEFLNKRLYENNKTC